MSQAPFVIQPQLTAITLAYRNARMIADMVLPRYPVDSQTFKYSAYTLADAFTVPNTRVGRKSNTNQIDWSATETPASTNDYGLEMPIPQADILQAASIRKVTGVQSVDPQARASELLTDLVALDREQRVANLVFAAGSYAAANKATLSGTSQWSDPTSDPIKVILAAFDTMMVRPNKGVIGRQVWSALSQHPKVIAAAYPLGGNAASGGRLSSVDALAQLLELDQILIGEGWINSAKKGQGASMVRVWGKHASFYFDSPVPVGPTGGMTFGITGEWGTRVAGTIENDPDIGLRGGTRVRVGESVKELILANDAGYLFTNAVA